MNEETWKENFCRLLQNKYFLSKHCSQSSARSPCQLGGGGGGGGPCHLSEFYKVSCWFFVNVHVAVIVAVGNLKKGCHLSKFHFKCCRYFLIYPSRASAKDRYKTEVSGHR